MTDRQTELVLEAARQLVAAAARHPRTDYRDPIELEARLIALAFAVRAYDRAETGRLRDADMEDRCCPDHRHS